MTKLNDNAAWLDKLELEVGVWSNEGVHHAAEDSPEVAHDLADCRMEVLQLMREHGDEVIRLARRGIAAEALAASLEREAGGHEIGLGCQCHSCVALKAYFDTFDATEGK